MDEMSKNMEFDYPEKPKFPEQETGHVYFDTVDGSVARTEKRTLTYADGTVSGVVYDDGDPLNLKKICEFKDAAELDGVLVTYGGRSKVIQGDQLENGASEMPGYSGEYAFHSSGGDVVFLDIDSAYSSAGFAEFPEPGLYVSEGVSFTFEVEIPPETNPFSKNVTVKAHTEYTANINGKIGESTGGLNGVFLRTDAHLTAITGATWEEARDAYVADKTVLLIKYGKTTDYYHCTGYDSANNKLSFTIIYWYSDGRIAQATPH